MIYTSYFANIKNLDNENIIPIAICGAIPSKYYGKWYRKLAPSWSIFSQYKELNDSIKYTQRYNKEILAKLDCNQVYQDLYNLANESNNFAMICYEKPDDFCHRHLVANWFTNHGIPCQEWIDPLKF